MDLRCPPSSSLLLSLSRRLLSLLCFSPCDVAAAKIAREQLIAHTKGLDGVSDNTRGRMGTQIRSLTKERLSLRGRGHETKQIVCHARLYERDRRTADVQLYDLIDRWWVFRALPAEDRFNIYVSRWSDQEAPKAAV